jgi:hypothetical protein
MGIGYRHLQNIIIIKLKKHYYDIMISSRTEDFFTFHMEMWANTLDRNFPKAGKSKNLYTVIYCNSFKIIVLRWGKSRKVVVQKKDKLTKMVLYIPKNVM